jgi:hypothetical protein
VQQSLAARAAADVLLDTGGLRRSECVTQEFPERLQVGKEAGSLPDG